MGGVDNYAVEVEDAGFDQFIEIRLGDTDITVANDFLGFRQ